MRSASVPFLETAPLPPVILRGTGGDVVLEDPVVLAPMSGVTDYPFRRLAAELGAKYLISEMIASWAMIRKNERTLSMARGTGGRNIHAVQLAGCDPQALAEAARLAVGAGAQVIDLNFGCPVKKVAIGQMAGSALMRDEAQAEKLIRATVQAVSVPVTLKIRMGWDHASLNAPGIAKIAQDQGVAMVTVHGRTRQMFYSGAADWDFVARVREAIDIPLLVNGDILTTGHAREALARSGADGVMVGRGCYGRPWLPALMAAALRGEAAAAPPGLEEELHIIRRHYAMMLEYFGERAGMRLAVKHLFWYSAALPGSAGFRAAISRLEDPLEVMVRVGEFYQELIARDFRRDFGTGL